MNYHRFNYPNFGFGTGFARLIQDAFQGLEDLGDNLARPFSKPQETGTDLYENDQSYFVVTELPGVHKPDVKVELADGTLTVNATLSKETSDGRKNIPIKRSVALPDLVGDGEIHAKLEDGVLTVTLPKAEVAKPRSIEVE